MTRFLAAQLARHHYFDIRRSKLDFGYSPQIATPEGMRRLAEKFGKKIARQNGGKQFSKPGVFPKAFPTKLVSSGPATPGESPVLPLANAWGSR